MENHFAKYVDKFFKKILIYVFTGCKQIDMPVINFIIPMKQRTKFGALENGINRLLNFGSFNIFMLVDSVIVFL